jgi:uncharacterized short protein YbdD (DUF466 family)
MCPPVWPNNGCGTRISIMIRALTRLKYLWQGVRTLTGEDAYERYLAHWHDHHGAEGVPLDRKTFYKQHQERKWNGISRCC